MSTDHPTQHADFDQQPDPAQHPDLDQLVALSEGALTGAERDAVLLHLSACADCRELLQTFAAAAPALASGAAEEAVATGTVSVTAAADPTPVHTPAQEASGRVLAWKNPRRASAMAAVGLAAAAGLAVVVTHHVQRSATPPPSSVAEMKPSAQVPPPEPPPALKPAPPTPQADSTQQSPALPSRTAAPAPAAVRAPQPMSGITAGVARIPHNEPPSVSALRPTVPGAAASAEHAGMNTPLDARILPEAGAAAPAAPVFTAGRAAPAPQGHRYVAQTAPNSADANTTGHAATTANSLNAAVSKSYVVPAPAASPAITGQDLSLEASSTQAGAQQGAGTAQPSAGAASQHMRASQQRTAPAAQQTAQASAVSGMAAPPPQAAPSTLVLSASAVGMDAAQGGPVALKRARSAAPPLPSGLAIATQLRTAHGILALDTAGTLFRAESGGPWQPAAHPWTGPAHSLAFATSPSTASRSELTDAAEISAKSAPKADAATSGAATPVQIRSADGRVFWSQDEGRTWRLHP